MAAAQQQLISRLVSLKRRLHLEEEYINDDQKPAVDPFTMKLKGHYDIQPGVQTFFTVIFAPAAVFLPLIFMSFFNECMNYAQIFTKLGVSLFIVAGTIMFIHLVIYNSITQFCTKLSMNTHHGITCIVIFSMGSTLGCMNLYAYSPSVLYWIWGTVSALTSFVFYLSAFVQRHHFRYCAFSGMPHLEQKRLAVYNISYSNLFLAFTVIYGVSWISFVAVSIQFSTDLYSPGLRPNSTYCVPIQAAL